MDVVYDGEKCLSIFVHFRETRKKTLGTFKKRLYFEQRKRKYANTWGGGGRARDQKSLQKHFYCSLFVFLTICFHFAFTFMCFLSYN